MPTSFSHSNFRSRINFLFLACFIVIAALFGGASRADALSQPVVRLAAILLIATSAFQLRHDEWTRIRGPILFLLVIAAVIGLQLIPLPPDLWAALPGRALYTETVSVSGLPPVWRPLSLTPDLTLNALLAVLPPLAAMLALGTIERALYSYLVPLLLICVAVSVMIGLIQISGGGPYFYDVTNEGSLVGVFANRNHQAALLAATLSLLAYWTAFESPDRAYNQLRKWVAVCAASAVMPLLLVTGSRGGLLLGGLGLLPALGIFLATHRQPRRGRAGRASHLTALPIVIGLIGIALTAYLSKDEAIDRFAGNAHEEVRFENLPIVTRMIGDFFPVGSGMGSFDTAFRAYERDESLSFFYFNHAHNDFAEVLIEAGVPALMLLVFFLVWFLTRSWRLWSRRVGQSGDLLGRTGSAIVAIMLASSTFDYPLRTPFLSVVFALACCWMIRNRGVAGNVQMTGLADAKS